MILFACAVTAVISLLVGAILGVVLAIVVLKALAELSEEDPDSISTKTRLPRR